MIQLDGNYGEGGGSLVRTALALSALTGQEFSVSNIRAGREQGGLKAQHLHAIKALQKICNAETNDVEIGSTQLYFKPGKIKSGIYEIDIGTAGSITLLLQALLMPCLFAPRTVTLKIIGGTCGKWQASADYLQNLLIPHLQRFIEKIEVRILKRGYYPKGGGEVEVKIQPRFKLSEFDTFEPFWQNLSGKCAKINLTEQGKVEQIRGVINLSRELEEKNVAPRIRTSAVDTLKPLQVPMNIRIEYVQSLSRGGEIVLWAVCSQNGKVDFDNPVLLGSDALIERGKRSEEIGKEAAQKLMQEIRSGAAADYHLTDQLIMFMGLLPGSEIKTSEITKHALTNMYVAEQFLPVKFEVEGSRVRVMENLLLMPLPSPEIKHVQP